MSYYYSQHKVFLVLLIFSIQILNRASTQETTENPASLCPEENGFFPIDPSTFFLVSFICISKYLMHFKR